MDSATNEHLQTKSNLFVAKRLATQQGPVHFVNVKLLCGSLISCPTLRLFLMQKQCISSCFALSRLTIDSTFFGLESRFWLLTSQKKVQKLARTHVIQDDIQFLFSVSDVSTETFFLLEAVSAGPPATRV